MPTGARPSEPSDGTPDPLRGRTVVLLGASGTVGRAVLARLLELGAAPAIPARKARQVAELRAALRDSGGGDARGFVAEVGARDGEAAAGFVKGATDALGPIAALITTAGAFRAAPVHRSRANDDLELMEANFLAVHNLVRAVVGPMIRRKTGSIVMTGSAGVGHGGSGTALYLASKAALHEYARALAVELAPVDVAVTLVTPGTIDTAANRAQMAEADRRDWTPLEDVVEWLVSAAVAVPTPGSAQPLRCLPPASARSV